MRDDRNTPKAPHDKQATPADISIDVIATRIRELREARGHSLAEVARRSGMEPARLEAIENGKKDPTILELNRIANGLEIPFPQLFSDLSPGAVVTAVLFEDAPPDLQNAVKTILSKPRGNA